MVKIRSDGKANLYAALAFIIMDIAVIALRIISKRKTKNGVRSDDWWLFAAFVFFCVWSGLIIYSVVDEAGSLEYKALQDALKFLETIKHLWIATFFFLLSITSTKISILCFYRSIFVTPRFRFTTHFLTGLCSLWCIIGVFFSIFQCKPIQAAYNLALVPIAKCKPYGVFLFGMELTNLILDVFILAIPIFVIRTIQLETRRKVLVASVFLLGGFVLVTCVLRIVYSYDPRAPQFVSDFSRATFWTTVQIGTAILCACLPTLRPLMRKDYGFPSILKSWYTFISTIAMSQRSRRNGSTKSEVKDSRHDDRFDNENYSTDRINQYKDSERRFPGAQPRAGESFSNESGFDLDSV